MSENNNYENNPRQDSLWENSPCEDVPCEDTPCEDTACEEIVNQFGGIAVPRGAQYLYQAVKKLTEEENL